MGEAEIAGNTIIIRSNIICYGDAATMELTEQIRKEIEMMWNEPAGIIQFNQHRFSIQFHITCQLLQHITDIDIYQNTDPKNNYFRIEEFAHGNISFVDSLGCNSGYFKLENLYPGSTTSAHEYGHTLGLDHPQDMDIRGKGIPGIMYPRGTLVDAPFQYDPTKPAGVTGGTMHPMFRKVKQNDIELLNLHKLRFVNGRSVIGNFTNIYHWNHAETGHEGFGAEH
jgi:hypothetical protein